jgi:hypothetical protein
MLVHRPRPAAPAPCLQAMAPDRDGLVVAVAGIGTWEGLAALCAHAGMPFVLGHALSRQALHGGQAKQATSDSPKMATLLRGGMLPKASVSPAAMRAPRDGRRRRTPLMRQRADRLAPVHKTHAPYPVPASGTHMASQAQRDGGAERCDAPAVPQPIAVDLALSPSEDQRLRARDRLSLTTAQPHEAPPLAFGPTVPGLGPILRLVLRDAMPPSERCPRGQDGASSGRLGTWAQAAGGQRWGPAGTTLGNAPLTWAFAEAAPRCLRGHEPGQQSRARGEHTHAQGPALRRRAPQRARAVEGRRKRTSALALEPCLRPAGRSAGEPGASRDPAGRRLQRTERTPRRAASWHAEVRRGPLALRPALGWDPRSGSCLGGVGSPPAPVGCPAPAPAPHWRVPEAPPALCGGR